MRDLSDDDVSTRYLLNQQLKRQYLADEQLLLQQPGGQHTKHELLERMHFMCMI